MPDTPAPTPDWPLLRVGLPPGTDEETCGVLAQAAADAGALGAQAGSGQLLVYLPREAGAAERVEAALRAEAARWACGELHVARAALADAPWATAWKADFVALPIGERLLVRPDWERGTAIPADFQTREVIYIRPGGGFGTARHETTRLALELLEPWVRSGTRVLDFGTGSGILALAAARLGAEAVLGLDYDFEAIVNARENLELNGLEARVRIGQADAPPSDAAFDLILCNMLPHEARPHLAALAGLLAAAAPPGTSLLPPVATPNSVLIYSGLLADQQEEIAAEMARHGLHAREWRTAAEWMAGVFGRGKG